MSEILPKSSITLLEGDAALVCRSNGEVLVVIPSDKPANQAMLMVLGCGLALENDEWRKKLVARTIDEWKKIKGEQLDAQTS